MTHINESVFVERRGGVLRIADSYWSESVSIHPNEVPALIQEICKLYGMELEVVEHESVQH